MSQKDRQKRLLEKCRCCIAVRVKRPATLAVRSQAASANELATAVAAAKGGER